MIVSRESGSPLTGLLTYSESEYSFRFDVASPVELLECAGGTDLASVSIGTLQIEVGVVSRRALFVWGLHPRARWLEASLPTPNWASGAVSLGGGEVEFIPGSSVAISSVGEWTTTYDPTRGWVRIIAPASGEDDYLTEIASGVLLGSADGKLNSIWMRPEFD